MTTVKTPTRSEQAPPGRPSRYGLRHLMFGVVVVALLLAALIEFGRELMFLVVPIAPVLLVVGVVVVIVKRRETEREALLRFLAIAAERRMPLAPGVEACAELCGRGFRRRASSLARLLDSGVPLPVALDAIPGLLPAPALVLACVGWAEGALAPALREAESAVAARRTYRSALLPKLAYLFAVLLAMQLVLGFIFYFIIPKFEAIFADFGVELPDLTVAAIVVSHGLLGTGLLPMLILTELALGAYLALSYFGYITWELPLVPWLLRRRDTAAVLRVLAVGIEADRPLESILTNLARVYPRSRVRHQLDDALVQISGGDPWIDALAGAGLIRGSDAAVLDAASRAGNLPWALRTLAETHDRRQGYRLAAATQLLFPALVLALALVAGLFVLSLFLPLIQLINQLAG